MAGNVWKQLCGLCYVLKYFVMVVVVTSAEFALTDRGGQPCQVWRNPDGLANEMRGLLTQSDLYVWQSPELLHADFERGTGLAGVHVTLREHAVLANNETVALPEYFPWLFPDLRQAEAMDVEDRRTMVADHLGVRLRNIYPGGFTVLWYS